MVGIFHVVTMPRFFYHGDNFTPRAEAANLLMTGALGLPYTFKQQNPEMFANRGQYLFENDAKQRLYSKYGIGYTFLYIPVVAVERLLTGRLEWMSTDETLLVILNIYNVFFTLVTTLYLYLIVAFYTKSRGLRIGFVLALFYTTFLWHYLRAPTLEIFQIAAFVGFGYHMLRFLRESEGIGLATQLPFKHLGFAVLYAGALLLMKSFFALLFLIIGLFALFPGPSKQSLWQRLRQNLSARLPLFLVYSVLPSVVLFSLWLGVNHYKFGSIFNMGYSQWLDAQGIPNDHWALEVFPAASKSLLLARGNANVFIHNPVFLFALAGWPLFMKKHRLEALLVMTVFLSSFLILCFFSSWSGEWCYGPRYLAQVLIIGSLPFVETWTLLARLRPAVVRWAGRILIGLVLGWSLLLQIYMNSLTYFSYYYVRGLFDQFNVPEIKAYFDNAFSRALLARDLREFDVGQKPYYPLQVLEPRIPSQGKKALSDIKDFLHEMARPNYFFFP
jgi:hypothetical protein